MRPRCSCAKPCGATSCPSARVSRQKPQSPSGALRMKESSVSSGAASTQNAAERPRAPNIRRTVVADARKPSSKQKLTVGISSALAFGELRENVLVHAALEWVEEH